MVDIFENRSKVARRLKQDNMFGNYILSVGYPCNNISNYNNIRSYYNFILDQDYMVKNSSFQLVIKRLSQLYQYDRRELYGIWDNYYRKVLN